MSMCQIKSAIISSYWEKPNIYGVCVCIESAELIY